MSITTERLTIRRIASGDWESMKRIWDDQKRSIYARFDRPSDTSPDAVRARIEKWASYGDSMDHMFFVICLSDTIIGYASFNRRKGGYETGYCFHSEYHGKGYAKESIGALIRNIQSAQQGAAITAGTALENIPSVRLLRSLGFRQIGTEKVSFYKDDSGQSIYFDGGIFEYTGR